MKRPPLGGICFDFDMITQKVGIFSRFLLTKVIFTMIYLLDTQIFARLDKIIWQNKIFLMHDLKCWEEILDNPNGLQMSYK